MNLQDTASWISIAKDVVTTTAAVVAAGVAVKGLHAWKRQLHGNANYELSRRLLRGAYKVREAIRSVRAPFMSLGEMNAAIRAAGLEGSVQNPDSETNFDKAESVAYQARWDKVVQAQLEFAADVLEAEVVWGPMIREKAETLAKCTAKLNVALAQWVARNRRRLPPQMEEKVEAVVYDIGEDSEFSVQLTAALADIEDVIRPHLEL